MQREECEDSEIPFVEQAQQLISQRKSNLLNTNTSTIPEAVLCSTPLYTEVPSSNALSGKKNDEFRISNPNIEGSSTSEDSDSNIKESNSDNSYYFYQCADGSPIFISSLNAKCLMNQYGSIKNAPETINAIVIEIEDFTMDEVLITFYFTFYAFFMKILKKEFLKISKKNS